MKFLLIHQYAGNKGDRAVLYAMCRLLIEEYPSSEIVVSTSQPQLWEGYKYYIDNNIRFIPSAWDYHNTESHSPYWKILDASKKYTFTLLRETYLRNIKICRWLANPSFVKECKASDVVLSVGGHHFTTLLSTDLVSGINFDSMVATIYHKMICFSQSFGPFVFHNPRNLEVTKKVLSKCLLMPRENKSKDEIIRISGNSANIKETYESVLSLSTQIPYLPINKRDRVLGIAIYCTQYRTPQRKDVYQNCIAGICNHAIKNGYSIRFFPMEIKGSGPDDRPFIHEIINKIEDKEKCYVYEKDLETERHMKEVSKCSLFLGHKTHSTIFALATGTPLLALAYHPKTREFLKQFNLEQNVIDDTDINQEILCEMFDSIEANLQSTSSKEYEQSTKIASKIKEDLIEAINSVYKR